MYKRSPGGTPLKKNSFKSIYNPITPQEIIAHALKKKFQEVNHFPISPESSPDIKLKTQKMIEPIEQNWEDENKENYA